MERGVEAPRAAFVPFPYNYPMGEPGDGARHREVAIAALALLHELREPAEVMLPFEWQKGTGSGSQEAGLRQTTE